MEPFEKIHIRAHLHGSRAKPSAGLTDPFKAVRPLNVSRAASSMQFFLSIAATSRPSYYVFLSECRERERERKARSFSQRKTVNALRGHPAQRNNTETRTWPPVWFQVNSRRGHLTRGMPFILRVPHERTNMYI